MFFRTRGEKMKIRPFEEKDSKSVRFVCLESAGKTDASEYIRSFLLNTYCNYYVENEPHNCFVAVDESDNAVGYILCAEDFDTFSKIFLTKYARRYLKFKGIYRLASKISILEQKKYKHDYPAHLHIDLLPEYQQKGLGRQLINALCDHLKKKGVKGVMLSVFIGNKGAIRFYEKCGFTKVKTELTSIVFAKELN